MAARSRYGDDPELTRATRRAALHVLAAFAVTALVVILSVALIGAKFGLYAVFHGGGSLLAWSANTLHWWGILLLFAGVVALTGLRLMRVRVRPQLPRDAELVPEEHPANQSLQRLASLADMPAPRLMVVPTDVPNSFVVDDEGAPVTICLTSGALDQCPTEELDAMLAHELFHVAHGDTTLFRRLEHLGDVARRRPPRFAYEYVVGAVRAMSRQRELSADRAAALLTGRPSALLAAVERCSGEVEVAPLRDLRDALVVGFVAGSRRPRHGGPPTHPTTAERAEVLARVSRELG